MEKRVIEIYTLEEFESVRAAAKHYGLAISTISKSINENKVVDGNKKFAVIKRMV